MTRKRIFAAVFLSASLLGMQPEAIAQTTPAPTPTKHTKSKRESAKEREIREMREQMQAQQSEIDALRAQISDKSVQAAGAQQSAAASQASAAAASAAQANAAASDNAAKVAALSSSVNDMKTTDAGVQETIIANQARTRELIESPAALHYKGLTITPVAFFAFEGVFRNRSLNSDINTPFTAIPFPSAVEGHTSELNFTGRQSRLGGLFEGNAGTYKLSGYFESDFLSAGTTSNNNQSNSYTFRVRQIWGKAETASGFAVTGGQTWSLVTEDGKGTDVRTEKLPNTIDSQYMVGFSWTRQPTIRFQQRFGDPKKAAFTAAMSLEQAQITNYTLNGAGNAPADYYFAGPGQNGGLYNAAGAAGTGNTASTGAITTYANNTAPDVVVKGAIDLPKAHFELGGIARFMRDFYLPATYVPATSTYTYGSQYVANTKGAGGIFGSVRVSPVKYVDLAVQAMAGQGTGRYGSAQLADATLRPDSTLEPIRNYHGMFSLETHPAKKLDLFAYYGGEYAQRTVYANANGALFGYGPRNLNDAGCYALPPAPTTAGTGGSIASPGTCASPVRYVQEDMVGFIYRLVNSPKYGRLQYSMTYSYLQRNLWSGSVATPVATAPVPTPTGPRALDNMIHVGMRYYIP
jgi:hypothetical protein